MGLAIGFLGHGFMGTAHANALARLPMFFPDAPTTGRRVLVGRDEDRLVSAADRLGFAETSTDWRAALDRIDVLYNLAPNYLHAEPSIAALERDIHVLSEKPLAHSLDAARRMADAAAESDAIAGVGFNYRFVPALRLAADLVAAGELGEIRRVSARYLQDWLVDPTEPWSWRNNETLAGSGALGDLGSHTIDLARFLVGGATGEIDRVSGLLRTFVKERPVADATDTRPVTVDDAFSAQATFDNGPMGSFEASRVAAGHKNDLNLSIHGSEGSLSFSLERLNELRVMRQGDRGYERVLVTDSSDPYLDAWWPPGHVLGWEHTFVHESYEFLSAIAKNERFQPDFEDGLAVQRVLAAIEQSDQSSEWMAV